MIHSILVLLVIIVSETTSAEGFYMGGGFSSVSLHSDHTSINDQKGTGYHLLVGTKNENWGFELSVTGGISFRTGETPGIYYPEDSAEYGILNPSVHRYFHIDRSPEFSPWLGAGFSIHLISWDTCYYNVDGYGYSVSGGMDFKLTSAWLFRVDATYHNFVSDDTYEYGPYDNNAAQIDFAMIYPF